MKQSQTEHQKQQQNHSEYTIHKNQQQGESEQQSSQQQQSIPGVDTIKAKWKQQVGAAKVTWGKLTDDELLQSEGHAEKLSGLVQERYLVSKEIANKQVKEFMDKCKC